MKRIELPLDFLSTLIRENLYETPSNIDEFYANPLHILMPDAPCLFKNTYHPNINNVWQWLSAFGSPDQEKTSKGSLMPFSFIAATDTRRVEKNTPFYTGHLLVKVFAFFETLRLIDDFLPGNQNKARRNQGYPRFSALMNSFDSTFDKNQKNDFSFENAGNTKIPRRFVDDSWSGFFLCMAKLAEHLEKKNGNDHFDWNNIPASFFPTIYIGKYEPLHLPYTTEETIIDAWLEIHAYQKRIQKNHSENKIKKHIYYKIKTTDRENDLYSTSDKLINLSEHIYRPENTLSNWIDFLTQSTLVKNKQVTNRFQSPKTEPKNIGVAAKMSLKSETPLKQSMLDIPPFACLLFGLAIERYIHEKQKQGEFEPLSKTFAANPIQYTSHSSLPKKPVKDFYHLHDSTIQLLTQQLKGTSRFAEPSKTTPKQAYKTVALNQGIEFESDPWFDHTLLRVHINNLENWIIEELKHHSIPCYVLIQFEDGRTSQPYLGQSKEVFTLNGEKPFVHVMTRAQNGSMLEKIWTTASENLVENINGLFVEVSNENWDERSYAMYFMIHVNGYLN